MMLLLHHLAIDHIAFEAMRSEVEAHLLGQEALLPPPPSFRNLVAKNGVGITRREHEIFFRQMLGDVEEPTAPYGLLDVQGDERRGRNRTSPWRRSWRGGCGECAAAGGEVGACAI